MKVFYHKGKDDCVCVDKSPFLSYQLLKSGSLVMWHDKTINGILNDIV